MRVRCLLVGIPVAVATIALSAAPAFATTYGTGSHSGSTSQTNSKLSAGCFETVGSYTSTGGSTTGSISDGAGHSYSGSLSVSWSYDFYQTSVGSTTDSTCATLGNSGSGSASGASITGTNGSQAINCSWGSDGTYYRNGTGTSALTIDFPNTGKCSIDGAAAVNMAFDNSGGFVQASGGGPSCSGSSQTSPPSSCDESFTFNVTS